MTNFKKDQKRMVYTPKYHIPVCEVVINDKCEVVLRFKKHKSQELEDVTLGELMTEAFRVVEVSQQVATSSEGRAL